jgi:hypothetical protein
MQLFIEKKLSETFGFFIGVKSLKCDKDPIRVPRMILPNLELISSDKEENDHDLLFFQHKNQ